jgi:thymidine phosphorylase
MVAAQGGDLDASRTVEPTHEILSPEAGYVTKIDTERLGYVVINLGGGRRQLGDKLDLAVGFEMLVRLGDKIEPKQPIAKIFAESDAAAHVKRDLLAAISIGDNRVEPPQLIVEKIQ